MKLFSSISLVIVGIALVAAGCTSSGGTVVQDEKDKIQAEENWTLKDHLRRASGVRLTGSEGSTRVIIRGESSVGNPGSQPLFIIDGQKAGRNFTDVNQMLPEGEIKYIDVLPPSRATQYGMEGNYGVIRIYTRG